MFSPVSPVSGRGICCQLRQYGGSGAPAAEAGPSSPAARRPASSGALVEMSAVIAALRAARRRASSPRLPIGGALAIGWVISFATISHRQFWDTSAPLLRNPRVQRAALAVHGLLDRAVLEANCSEKDGDHQDDARDE